MKLRMITFHTPKNYGAVLQSFSLMSYLKSQGHDVKIIDFKTDKLANSYPIVPRYKGLRGLAKKILLIPTYPYKILKYRKFDEFGKQNYDLTHLFSSTEQLRNEKWSDDTVFVTGSDQIFNPHHRKEEKDAFFLDFVPTGMYKMSYAGSFGVAKIEDRYKSQIANYLSNFDSISVRESEGAKFVKELTGRDATEVLDPVFLNNKDFWLKVAKSYKKNYKNYVLYYRLQSSPYSDKVALEIAAQKGLKLVVITGNRFKSKGRNIKIAQDVGPEEFLSLFSGADFVVTDSFHGTAFSLLFEKQFVYSDNNPEKSIRGRNIITKTGALNALLENYSPANSIDYSLVNEKLAQLRATSCNYITEALTKAENR